jgi:YHS domain-containing protein
MRIVWLGIWVWVAAFLFVGCGSEKKESQTGAMNRPEQARTTSMTVAQTTCPVMGGNINREVYMDYEGKRVYFCCPSCIGEFEKDPERYMKKMTEEGVTLEDSPAEEASGEGSHEGHGHD